MAYRYTLEVITLIAIVGYCALFLFTCLSNPDAEFGGSDDVGSSQVAELTGMPEDEIQPLIWQWEPPSGEIESGLFALQAAVGGIIIGWVLGYWRGQKKTA
ncbi:MAG: energy-coupling factor ABC transporter substrate-binding protein [Methanoculleaceae archaeon]